MSLSRGFIFRKTVVYTVYGTVRFTCVSINSLVGRTKFKKKIQGAFCWFILYIINATLLTYYVAPTCFGPKSAILRGYDWYISGARSTKRVTRCKIQIGEKRVIYYVAATWSKTSTTSLKHVEFYTWWPILFTFLLKYISRNPWRWSFESRNM
jgi:hypothetical protein